MVSSSNIWTTNGTFVYSMCGRHVIRHSWSRPLNVCRTCNGNVSSTADAYLLQSSLLGGGGCISSCNHTSKTSTQLIPRWFIFTLQHIYSFLEIAAFSLYTCYLAAVFLANRYTCHINVTIPKVQCKKRTSLCEGEQFNITNTNTQTNRCLVCLQAYCLYQVPKRV